MPSDKWYCHYCRKAAYGSEGRGWEAIRTIAHLPRSKRTEIIPCRVYPCPHGQGWHLTHHRERSYL